MARRRLLSPDQWAGFLAVPDDERELVRHYTLGREDLDLINPKRTAHNRRGFAVLLCYLRYPGRMPEPDETPPPALLAFVAHQVGAEPADYAEYRRRGQTGGHAPASHPPHRGDARRHPALSCYCFDQDGLGYLCPPGNARRKETL